MNIRGWLNQNGMVIAIMIIIVVVGGYIVETMLYEIKKGDISEIGASPDIIPLIVCLIVVGITCIVLEYCKRCRT